MFQLLGVELVRMAKTRFGGRRKNRRAPLILSYVSGSQTPFIVSICFFSDKALGRCRTERDCTPYHIMALQI